MMLCAVLGVGMQGLCACSRDLDCRLCVYVPRPRPGHAESTQQAAAGLLCKAL